MHQSIGKRSFPWKTLSAIIATTCTAESVQAVEIINQYPACDYKVIDTIKKSVVLPKHVSEEDHYEYKQRLISKIRSDAKEQEVQLVALTDKKNITDAAGRQRIMIEAQFIASCKAQDGFEARSTPLSAQGDLQIGIDVSTDMSYSFTIDLNAKKPAPMLPEDALITA